MIIVRTAVVTDPFARANVMEALAGRGAPAGVVSCVERGLMVVVEFDDECTSPDLIDDLIAIETAFVPGRIAVADIAATAAELASRGLNEPALDITRIIETYL